MKFLMNAASIAALTLSAGAAMVTSPTSFKVATAELETAFCTKAVVAIFVVLSPAVGVGAVGEPVNAGDDIGALASRADCSDATSAMV